MQLRIIDLRRVRGLTFFFSFSKLYAVHGHTRAAPYANRNVERLFEKRQGLTCTYLPIPIGEEITVIALRLRNSLGGGHATVQKPFFLVN